MLFPLGPLFVGAMRAIPGSSVVASRYSTFEAEADLHSAARFRGYVSEEGGTVADLGIGEIVSFHEEGE